jgi:hypothetical protein
MFPEWTQEKWCPGAELNHRHADFQFSALLFDKTPELTEAVDLLGFIAEH